MNPVMVRQAAHRALFANGAGAAVTLRYRTTPETTLTTRAKIDVTGGSDEAEGQLAQRRVTLIFSALSLAVATVAARGAGAPSLPTWVPLAGDRVEAMGRVLVLSKVNPIMMGAVIVRVEAEASGA